MPNVIEYLEERDDVKKTAYTRMSEDDQFSPVEIEMWHDVDGLYALFERARDGHISEKGLMDVAEKRALAVRETKVDGLTKLKAMHDGDQDYEYPRPE